MPRSLILGNGNLLVCIDKYAQIRDFYFPFVGQENHVEGHRHLIGVWAENQFSWTHSNDWIINIKYKKDAMIGETTATNNKLRIEITIENCVHYEKDIYMKRIIVKNLDQKRREIRLFLNPHFNIFTVDIGNTVYFEPVKNVIIFYKGMRYFLINGLHEGRGFDDYATGIADFMNLEGTYVDAEDGILSKNPIEHGSVDATVAFHLFINGNSEKEVEYWITAGKKYKEVCALNEFVLMNGVKKLINETENYWRRWVNRKSIDLSCIEDIKARNKIIDLFKISLLIIRAQTDNRGAIMAANDSDVLQVWKDTYSYMWPRDGAIVAMALDKAGYPELSRNFFNFCENVLTKEGFLLHKYRPDRSLGSSWHPWVRDGKLQFPIQEDETALVLYSLWHHYRLYKDKEFIKKMYKRLVKKSADFMVKYRDQKTKLPKESYDLWEEKLVVSTFTSCAVCAGLFAASEMAKLLGKKEAKKYYKAYNEIRQAIEKYLFDDERNAFVSSVFVEGDKLRKDIRVDASTLCGLFRFNIFDADDKRIKNTAELIKQRLTCKTNIGGMARYENDKYHRITDDVNVPGNPWFISTLWLAQYYIAIAKDKEDMTPAFEILKWVTDHAIPSGVLAEQINPYTGEPVSVSPLTWSHAEFVLAVLDYVEKIRRMKID